MDSARKIIGGFGDFLRFFFEGEMVQEEVSDTVVVLLWQSHLNDSSQFINVLFAICDSE